MDHEYDEVSEKGLVETMRAYYPGEAIVRVTGRGGVEIRRLTMLGLSATAERAVRAGTVFHAADGSVVELVAGEERPDDDARKRALHRVRRGTPTHMLAIDEHRTLAACRESGLVIGDEKSGWELTGAGRAALNGGAS